MKRLIILLSLAMFLILPMVIAEQINNPTQQFNKIFLNPFYRNATTLNTNYTYNVIVTPSDGISKVSSAIITFEVWITPTVEFTLWVNNKSCNNPSYLVHTTYADSGLGQIHFDCSNVINSSGTYQLILRPTQANTGSVTGWLDLTYMNKPQGALQVSGTEYFAGDPATVFVQLRDSSGNPLNNGSCYLNMWYPNNESNVHPQSIFNAPMQKATGDQGLYYYDMIAPNQIGVYMLSASCAYAYDYTWIYPEDENVYYPIPEYTTGTWVGSAQVLNSKSDDDYERCSAAAAVLCQANYTFNTSQYGTITNISSVSLYFAGQGDVAAKTVTFAYWNGTAFVNLPNIWTTVATGASATVPGDIDQFVSNTIPSTAIINGTVKIRYTGQTGLARYYHNWLSLAILTSGGSIQDVKGSSEMHISSMSPNGNRYFTIDTCGGYIDGRCGEFTDDGEFDLLEGEVEDFVNITATMSKTEADIIYNSPFAIDCTALYWIKMFNGTGWEDFTNYTFQNQEDSKSCLITLNKDITLGESYSFWFKFDNYMKWEVEWVKKMSDSVNQSVYPLCSDRNFTYTVPITESTNTTNDSITDFCYQFYDDQYWINNFYDDSLSITDAGTYSAYVGEMRFYRDSILDRYQFLVSGNNTDLMSEFYAQKNWEYSNRSLTELNFEVNATINNTAVASAVWGYDGTITPNIVQQIVNATWTYTGTVSSNLLNQMSNSVWSYNGNSTTGMVTAVVNATWEYTGGRYTHGVVLSP